MAIEIIPKKEQEKPSSITAFIYYLGKFLLIFSVILCLAFAFFQWRFSQEIKAIDNSILIRKTADVLALESKIDNYGRKTRDFVQLIQGKKSSKSFFQAMEDVIHPDVVLTSFEANVSENEINITAIASNITVLDQQARLFRSRLNQTIHSFDISEFSREKDRTVVFPAKLTLIAGDIVCYSEKSNSMEISVDYVNAFNVYLFHRNQKIAGPLSSGSQYLFEGLTPRTTYELHLRNGDSASIIPFSTSFCRTSN